MSDLSDDGSIATSKATKRTATTAKRRANNGKYVRQRRNTRPTKANYWYDDKGELRTATAGNTSRRRERTATTASHVVGTDNDYYNNGRRGAWWPCHDERRRPARRIPATVPTGRGGGVERSWLVGNSRRHRPTRMSRDCTFSRTPRRVSRRTARRSLFVTPNTFVQNTFSAFVVTFSGGDRTTRYCFTDYRILSATDVDDNVTIDLSNPAGPSTLASSSPGHGSSSAGRRLLRAARALCPWPLAFITAETTVNDRTKYRR